VSISVSTRVQLALDVAEGMQFLHKRRIVHRDLKSSNVLVQQDQYGKGFIAKIADFGLSRIIMSQSRVPNSGSSRSSMGRASFQHHHAAVPTPDDDDDDDYSYGEGIGVANKRVYAASSPYIEGLGGLNSAPSYSPRDFKNNNSNIDSQWNLWRWLRGGGGGGGERAPRLDGGSVLRASSSSSSSRRMMVGRSSSSKMSNHPKVAMTTAMGTIEYLAPELLEAIHIFGRRGGGAMEIDAKRATALYGYEVDVYAYSIIMWELATRRYPYEAVKTPRDVQQMVLAGLRLRLPAGCRIPERYVSLMNKCWQEKPSSRPSFRSAAEILKDIWFNDCSALDDEDGTNENSGTADSERISSGVVDVKMSAEQMLQRSLTGNALTEALLEKRSRGEEAIDVL